MHSSLIFVERIKRMFKGQRNKTVENMLIKENEQLKDENAQLRSRLERMEAYVDEYGDLVDELKVMRDKYKKELDNIEQITEGYKKELDKIVS